MKQNVLTYFMWGYQPHFRVSIEHYAGQVFAKFGITLQVKALLIGIRVPEVLKAHPVCVEPEKGDWDLSLFSRCHERAEEIYPNHPEHQMFYGDEPRMLDQPENIRRMSALQAVEEVFDNYDTKHATRTFCGTPVRVGNYHVVPVIQVSKAEFDLFPQIPQPFKYREQTLPTGIVEILIRQLLSWASEGLDTKEPGRFLNYLDVDVTSLLRRAANSLCNTIQIAIGDYSLYGIFNAINEISSLRYEGGETSGEIVFAPPNCPSLQQQVTFLQPVPLTSHRLARKIVEMSASNLACVCSSGLGLSGLVTVKMDDKNSIFRAVFTGHYRWEFYFNKLLLMTCAFGIPTLPSPQLTEAEFTSNTKRILIGLSSLQCHTLWEIVSAAMEQRHGTMIVVSEAADTEAKRLQAQSLPITPIPLTPELVRHISGIDGAILVDRDCRCHALGVILDGLASKNGDSSRGARFNSAIRYVESAKVKTICLVVSEDGHVNMIPKLLSQVSRDEIQMRVEQLAKCNNDNYHNTRNWLDDHRFYLNAEQCKYINRELARIDAEPTEIGRIHFPMKPFLVNPEMNDSYYFEDSLTS
ncbi:DNA integrity scanning protein DisA nucleotide-binding domain protein [Chamaesiphon sp.]|uniref:DNA integrity scanning protein DisA nucleotide-binding domain protein n=1 Tax=Chamaesiphon sp. TaxID=2814140 RepID=UPI003593B679